MSDPLRSMTWPTRSERRSRFPAVITGERWRVRQAVQAPGIQRHGIGTDDKARHQLGHAARRNHVIARSEEHTSELQSLMSISYAVFCLQKKSHKNDNHQTTPEKTKST